MRRRIADWLCRIACALRGQEWYVADVWHGVPGNRIAELQQRIQQNIVTMYAIDRFPEELAAVEQDVQELCQAAGECWGHVWPKEKR